MVVLTELAPAHLRKQAFALQRLAINLGMSVGPAVGGFLATRSFPAVFRWMPTTLLAWAVLVAARFAVTRTQPEAGATLSAAALADGRLRYALLSVLPVAMVFFQLESAIPLFLVHGLGLSTAVYGGIFTLNTLIIVTTEIPLNALTAHWPARRTLAIGSAFAAAGISAFGLAHDTFGVMVSTVIFTIGEMILFPGMSAYAAEIAPADRRGEYMGLYTMTYSTAMALGPWVGTVVLEGAGPATLWSGTLVLGLCSAAAFWRMPRPPPRPA